MALNDILQKITSDAETEVKNILDEARKEEHSLVKDAQKKEQDFQAQADIAKERHASKVYGRIITKARHAVKIKEDENLRQLIDKVFETVSEKICSLPTNKYEELVEKNLKSLPHDARGIFYIAPEKEKETRTLIEKSSLKKNSIKTVEQKTLLGGFIFETEDREFDYSLRSLLADLRKQKEIEISQRIIKSIHG